LTFHLFLSRYGWYALEYYLFRILPPYDLFTRQRPFREGYWGREIHCGTKMPRSKVIYRYLQIRNKVLYLLVYTSLYIFNINWCTARVGVGLAYLQNVMQDSACPSSLHKNRSFSREVTYAQRESLGFSCGSLNFKATEIVAQTSTTMKAAHASWKMDFSILISTRVSVSCFLFIFCFSVYIYHISKVYRL